MRQITRRLLAKPRGDMDVERGYKFRHPVMLPIKRLRGENDPIASPYQWALRMKAPITPALKRAEAAYRKKYGGEIVECETPPRRPVCRCGAYRLRWP